MSLLEGVAAKKIASDQLDYMQFKGLPAQAAGYGGHRIRTVFGPNGGVWWCRLFRKSAGGDARHCTGSYRPPRHANRGELVVNRAGVFPHVRSGDFDHPRN